MTRGSSGPRATPDGRDVDRSRGSTRRRPPRDTGGDGGSADRNAAAEALSRARQMILDGDNAGCIDVLTHAPQTCRNIEVLVTCYKGEGRMPDAYTAMENYVRRCDGQRKFEEYLQILQGVGRAP